MKDYVAHLTERDQKVDGIGPWMWIGQDHGAWDGPSHDWTNHLKAYRGACKNYDTVVCAGGNQGMYPRLFSEFFKVVYTFEPDPLNFHCLVNNCQKDNIVKINAALGETSSMCVVKRAELTNTGMHTVDVRADAYIPMFTIDMLALSSCDLIQLDIEGYEIHALRGALNTINKFHPVIACERGNQDIEQLLSQYGYVVSATSHADTIYHVP